MYNKELYIAIWTLRVHHSPLNVPEACGEMPWERLNDLYVPKLCTSGALIHALYGFIGAEVSNSYEEAKV